MSRWVTLSPLSPLIEGSFFPQSSHVHSNASQYEDPSSQWEGQPELGPYTDSIDTISPDAEMIWKANAKVPGIEPKDLDWVQPSMYQFHFLGYNGVVVDHHLEGIKMWLRDLQCNSSGCEVLANEKSSFLCPHPVHLSAFGSTVMHACMHLYYTLGCGAICLWTFALLTFLALHLHFFDAHHFLFFFPSYSHCLITSHQCFICHPFLSVFLTILFGVAMYKIVLGIFFTSTVSLTCHPCHLCVLPVPSLIEHWHRACKCLEGWASIHSYIPLLWFLAVDFHTPRSLRKRNARQGRSCNSHYCYARTGRSPWHEVS